MSLRESLSRLEQRIDAIACTDPASAAALRADLEVLSEYARDPRTLRALEILIADLDLLADLERSSSAPSELPASSSRRTDEDIIAAVEQHGGIRAAARALGIDPATVSRRWRKVLRSQHLQHHPGCV